jgi:hypothetical protein
MDDLTRLTELDMTRLAEMIQKRNALEYEITTMIRRPALLGHIGEYIASRIFHIALAQSASQKSIDGYFSDSPLANRSVNIKWYARQEGLLDITPNALPDYYLVLTGPKSLAMSSRGQVRSWAIEHVYLFQAQSLVNELNRRGVKIGIATSVAQSLWANAEIYPAHQSELFELSEDQRQVLALFSSKNV